MMSIYPVFYTYTIKPFIILFTKISSGYVKSAFCASDNLCNIFGIIVHHIFNTAETATIYFTYMQFENNHITFMNENNALTVVMVRPKSSKCT